MLNNILHFSGNFVFQMPRYNNDPQRDTMSHPEDKFDGSKTSEEVFKLCGSDPSRYFEFVFRNVKVNQVTYNDYTVVTDATDDFVIGQKILLYGLMVDVSPSAVCSQLFASTLKVGNLLAGNLQTAIQSDLRINIRPQNTTNPFSSENAGAHFETIINLTDKTSPEDSRFLSELGDMTQLEFYMHLNRYTVWNTEIVGHDQDKLNGDVYGYIRPAIQSHGNNGFRVKSRRIVAHPDLKNSSKLLNIFLGKIPLTRNTDIDGTYDILKSDKLLVLRCLDFIPFLDRDRNTPTDMGIVKEYIVFLVDQSTQEQFKLGSFKGDRAELQRSGGIFVSPIPEKVLTKENLILLIQVLHSNDDHDNIMPLMIESKWDLTLESKRAIALGSKQFADITARIYHLNKPAANCPVRLSVQPSAEMLFLESRNESSPIVAIWKQTPGDISQKFSDSDGRVVARVEAINLENLEEPIFDPVKNTNVKGELDWDRYYGNYVYMDIENESRLFQYEHKEQIEIAVRVLHVIEKNDYEYSGATFDSFIFPKLLKFYVRYFPWLHTNETQNDMYMQFLNLEDYNSFSSKILEALRRLSLENDNWDKMPRSRDFPLGGVELLTFWLTKGMPK
jgi:hypothetical protein